MAAERKIRTTVELPESLHRRLSEVAARKGCSPRELIVESVEKTVVTSEAERPVPVPGKRLDLSVPIIPSTGKPINFTSEELHDLIEFP